MSRKQGSFKPLISKREVLKSRDFPKVLRKLLLDLSRQKITDHKTFKLRFAKQLQSITKQELKLLLEVFTQFTNLKKISQDLKRAIKLLVFEGATGVGKTTLVESLSYPLIREHVQDNFWLSESFMGDRTREAAFGAQLHFMLGRISDLVNAYLIPDFLKRPVLLADRFFKGDEAYIINHFQAGNLNLEEYELLFAVRALFSEIIPLDYYTIFLFCEPQDLAKRIIGRGRNFEIANIAGTIKSQDLTMEVLHIKAEDIPDFPGFRRLKNKLFTVNTSGTSKNQVTNYIEEIISEILGFNKRMFFKGNRQFA